MQVSAGLTGSRLKPKPNTGCKGTHRGIAKGGFPPGSNIVLLRFGWTDPAKFCWPAASKAERGAWHPVWPFRFGFRSPPPCWPQYYVRSFTYTSRMKPVCVHSTMFWKYKNLPGSKDPQLEVVTASSGTLDLSFFFGRSQQVSTWTKTGKLFCRSFNHSVYVPFDPWKWEGRAFAI